MRYCDYFLKGSLYLQRPISTPVFITMLQLRQSGESLAPSSLSSMIHLIRSNVEVLKWEHFLCLSNYGSKDVYCFKGNRECSTTELQVGYLQIPQSGCGTLAYALRDNVWICWQLTIIDIFKQKQCCFTLIIQTSSERKKIPN